MAEGRCIGSNLQCPDVGAAALRSGGGIAAAQFRVAVGRRWRSNGRAHWHQRCELRCGAPRLRVAIQPTTAHALPGEYHACRITTMFLDHNFKQPINLFKVARYPASFGKSRMYSPASAARKDADERKRRSKSAIAEQQVRKRLPIHHVEGAVAATVQEDQYGPR